MHNTASVKATGGGSGIPRLKTEDEKIAVIIRDSTISSICSQDHTDMLTAVALEGGLIM